MSIDFDHLTADDQGPGSTNIDDFAAVIARAADMSDDVPVLLLPVRLETRFVEFDRPTVRAATMVGLIATLGAVSDDMVAIGQTDFATWAEPTNIAGRAALRDSRRDTEKELVAELLTVLAADGKRLHSALLDARVAMPGTVEEIAALRDVVSGLDGVIKGAQASANRLRSDFHRAEVVQTLDEFLPDAATLLALIERRTIPTALKLAGAAGDTILTDELWVRIYPDDIAVDAHEETLTVSEQSSGRSFWTETLAAGGDETLQRGAWRVLCQRHGSRRAAWIADQTRPAALAAAPGRGVVQKLEMLDRRIEEVAAAADPARVAMLDRAVAKLASKIPHGAAPIEPAILDLATSLLASIRRKAAAMSADRSARSLPAAVSRKAGRRVIDVLRAARDWCKEAQGYVQRRRDEAARARLALDADARVLRALDAFDASLRTISTRERQRAKDWTPSLSDAIDAAARVVASDPAEPQRTPPRVDQLISAITASLDRLATETRRSKLMATSAQDVLKLARRWAHRTRREAQRRMAASAVVARAGVPAGSGAGMLRALETFDGALDAFAQWEAKRSERWSDALLRALNDTTKALQQAPATSDRLYERAERLMATAAAKLDGWTSEALRRRLAADHVRRVRAQTDEMTRAWNAWRAKTAAAPHQISALIREAETKSGSWTTSAGSTVLPDRFVLATVSADKVSHLVVGGAVPPDLDLSLNPDPAAAQGETFRLDAKGRLQVAASIRWMVDFNEAAGKGMGIVLPITPEEAVAGFDRIYVIGLCSGSAADGQERIGAMLDNHHFGQTGLGLLPIGTPTNNSEKAAAGYRSTDDADAAYDIERSAPLFDAAAPEPDAADGLRLARALGLDPAKLAHVAHAGGRDVAEAKVVNAALWPATLGHYLEEFFGSLFPVAVLDLIKAQALSNVAARGMVPGLRVGEQPYGILPTTVYSTFANDQPAASFAALLPRVLSRMNDDWTRLRDLKVQYAHRADVADTQQQFLEMLGLEGVSVSAEYRFALNCARHQPKAAGAAGLLDFGVPGDGGGSSLYGPVALLARFSEEFRAARGLGAGPVLDRGQVSATFKDPFLRLMKTRAYEVRYLSEPKPLTGTVIGDHVAYIPHLLNQGARQLAAQTRSGDTGPMALLHMLLRQALLLETREAALRILAAEGMLTNEARRRSGESDVFQVHTLDKDKDWSVTRWSYLFEPLSQLDGRFSIQFPNAPGSFYNYMRSGGDAAMDAYVSPRAGNPVFNGYARHAAHARQIGAMSDHAAVVAKLASLPADRLEALVLEHLDTCSHRLDAWMTGLAHGRLAEMRTRSAQGVFVGMFGWLLDLRPADDQALAKNVAPALDDDPGTPIHVDPHNQGFIHAPSLNHAVTAAILRSGYLSEATQPDVDNKMAVNLSSRRVRVADQLIEGVRLGNDLGSLLGYELERSLHESFANGGITLDYLIAPLRRAYPSTVAVDPALARAATAPRGVVDGLAIVQTVLNWVASHPQDRYRNLTLFDVLRDGGRYTGWPWGLKGSPGEAVLPTTQSTDQPRLDAVLTAFDHLADALDALGDLVVSEGVYQIVQGNHARAAAVVGALAQGKAPPHPEIMDTPRSGTAVTQRVLLALKPVDVRTRSTRRVKRARSRSAPMAARALDWDAMPMTPRAAAQASLNLWLGKALGTPQRIRARAREIATGAFTAVSAVDLGLQPVDLLAILGAGFEAGEPELTARVLDAAWSDVEPPPTMEIDWSVDPADVANSLGFADASGLLEAVHELISHGRSASAHEFTLAESDAVDASVDADELKARAQAAIDGLEATGLELIALLSDGTRRDAGPLADPDPSVFIAAEEPRFLTARDVDGKRRIINLDHVWATRDAIRQALYHAAEWGVPGVLPTPTTATRTPSREQTAREWLDRMQAAFAAISLRLQAARHAFAVGAAAADPVKAWTAVLKAAFGDVFAVMPHFVLDPAAPALTSLNSTTAPAADPALSGWLHATAMVRAQTALLAQAIDLTQAFGGAIPKARPLQLPYVKGEAWLGAEWPEGFTPAGGRLSMAVFGASQLANDGTASCAWLIDQWEEVVPAREETTGIAYHYNAPDATPPQSLLLAVPPVRRGVWRWSELLQMLHETLELAKNRAVELEHLQGDLYGQILPAVVGEVVPESVTSTESELTGSRVILDFGRNNPVEKPPEENARARR